MAIFQGLSVAFIVLCMISLTGLLLLPDVLESYFTTSTDFKRFLPPVKKHYQDVNEPMALPLLYKTSSPSEKISYQEGSVSLSSTSSPSVKTVQKDDLPLFSSTLSPVKTLSLLSSTAFSSTKTFSQEDSTTQPITLTITSSTISPNIGSKKPHILIFIGVMSAPSRKERRDAIRKTWLTHCRAGLSVCLFFSDNQDWYGQPLDESITKPLQEESKANGYDMILANAPGGINFSLRYLWMAEYAIERFEFDYFLRMDDDHFLCIDRLLWELPQRPKTRLVWGYQHCVTGIVRVDEGWHLTSADVVKEFVSKKNTSVCHPYGDQAISLWLNNMAGMIYFADNSRVYHSMAANNPGLKKRSEICHSYLSLHGSYPADMISFWQIVKEEPTTDYTLSPVEDRCKLSKVFKWQTFSGYYYAEPKPCKDNPTWQKGRMYRGRGR